MDLHLKNKVAIVTGASKGIGLATVKTLLAEGAVVVAVARRLTADLANTDAHFISADLRIPQAASQVITETINQFGKLDILINNLGGGDEGAPGASFPDLSDELWEEILDVNLLAGMRMTRYALPELSKTRGSIVNVSSDAARRPTTGPLPYSVAKAGTNALSKALAEQFSTTEVRVNVVSPALTRSGLWEGEDSYGAKLAHVMGIPLEQLVRDIPGQLGMLTGRMIEPNEVASTIAYVASPLAASVIGSNWVIDGGAADVM